MCCPFSLCEICQIYVLRVDLGVKPSAPSCPPTLSPYPGLQTEQTESQRSHKKGCLCLTGNPNWDSNCLGLSGNPNWDSNCPHGGPNNSCLRMSSDYSGFSRNSDRRSKRWDGGQETKRRGKTGFSNLSLGSYAQNSQRDWGTATQAVASLWNTHREK